MYLYSILFILILMGCSDSAAEIPQGESLPKNQQNARKAQIDNPPNSNPSPNNTNQTNLSIQLAKHNQYRAKHHAQPLILSDWLSQGAQKWADYLATNKKFEHSQCNISGKGVGQNIYWSSVPAKAGDASKAWYDEVKDYKYGSGEPTFSKTGHFSQVVWKESKQVGFGFSGGIVVGNYYPAGNLMGSWQKNVQKP